MTHAVRLDFLAPQVRHTRLGVVLLVAGVLAAGAAVMDDAKRSDELANAQEALERAGVQYRRIAANHASKHVMQAADLMRFGDIARRLSPPWGGLLDALEQADSESVALLVIEPDAERGRLRISGEAKNLDVLIEYVNALDGRAGISDLRLITQQAKENDVQHPVEFTLDAKWLRHATAADTERTRS